ncbi:MAG: hypothetical protein ACYCRD_04575 [Leptospirillum sp.]
MAKDLKPMYVADTWRDALAHGTGIMAGVRKDEVLVAHANAGVALMRWELATMDEILLQPYTACLRPDPRSVQAIEAVRHVFDGTGTSEEFNQALGASVAAGGTDLTHRVLSRLSAEELVTGAAHTLACSVVFAGTKDYSRLLRTIRTVADCAVMVASSPPAEVDRQEQRLVSAMKGLGLPPLSELREAPKPRRPSL